MDETDDQSRSEYEIDRELFEILEQKEFVLDFQKLMPKNILFEHGGQYD